MKAKISIAVACSVLLLPLAATAQSSATTSPGDAAVGGQAAESRDSRFVELKLKESARLTLRGARFVATATASATSLNRVLAQQDTESLRPLFAGPPVDLRREATALRQAGQRVPDLSQWYNVRFASPAAAREGAAKLSGLPHVVEAYVMPKAPPPPSTPDFEDQAGVPRCTATRNRRRLDRLSARIGRHGREDRRRRILMEPES